MEYDELIKLLIERQALMVHCSRPGKADGPGGRLFPDDLQHAIDNCGSPEHDLSCSVVWPDHVETFGAVGIILRPRSLDSITSICRHDSGSFLDQGKLENMGDPFSAQAVEETFNNSEGYNEWTVTDADTVGIFINLSEPLDVAREVQVSDVPGYDPSMGEFSVVSTARITVQDVMAAFSGLPVYGFVDGKIARIDEHPPRAVDAASIYRPG